MPRTLVTLAGLALSMSTAAICAAQSPVQQSQAHPYRLRPVAEGLVNPWSMAFLPNGDILVTERPGRLRLIRDGALVPEPIAGVPQVRARGQGGLLDVALHPNFASNNVIYLTYSKPSADGSQGTTALIRARLDGTRLADVQEIFEAKAWSTTNGHYGSRLAFDAQGFLFMTVGDRQAPPSGVLARHPAQNLQLHQGKILRLHDDGRVPADNPFVGRSDALPEIWSYGHRSPQGLLVHPENGDVWMTEHGPQGGDELNRIQRGRNYGWPVIGFGVNYGADRVPIHESSAREGMEQPATYWVPSIATSGLLVYTGDRFPQWRGNLFAGGLAGEQLVRLTVDGQRVLARETLVQNQGRIRDIKQGPDGLIYLAIDAAQGPTIVRLEPATMGSR